MIKPTETEITGRWEEQRGSVVEDPACQRIKMLIKDYLQLIARSDDGWSSLYKDPKDGRFWELTYPHSDWHGGGPPSLIHISQTEAKKNYSF